MLNPNISKRFRFICQVQYNRRKLPDVVKKHSANDLFDIVNKRLRGKNEYLSKIYTAIVLAFSFLQTAKAQAAETYTGTIISYNGPRLRMALFTVRITGRASDEQARQYLDILEKDGQEKTLDAITKNNSTHFPLTAESVRQSISSANP